MSITRREAEPEVDMHPEGSLPAELLAVPAALAIEGSATEPKRVDVLKVSSKSHPSAVAGAIAGVIRSHGRAEIQVVGAGALNQAIKGIAVARGFLAEAGLDVVCTPSFAIVDIDGESRTALRLVVDDRSRSGHPSVLTPSSYAVHS